jgi:tRNA threonylcarbamoyladenosine biosynthesis protein TsaE
MEFWVTKDHLNEFAAAFWKAVGNGKIFAFHGQMGAGKTTLISFLCHYKGTKDVTGSPTFSIINEYIVEGTQKIYHIDLYRLKDEEEVMQTGVEDCVDSGDICMIEWPEKAPQLFDEKTVHVFIEPTSERERMVILKLPAPVKSEK